MKYNIDIYNHYSNQEYLNFSLSYTVWFLVYQPIVMVFYFIILELLSYAAMISKITCLITFIHASSLSLYIYLTAEFMHYRCTCIPNCLLSSLET